MTGIGMTAASLLQPEMHAIYERFYRNLVEAKPDQGVFLKGWLNRLNSLRNVEDVLEAGSEQSGG